MKRYDVRLACLWLCCVLALALAPLTARAYEAASYPIRSEFAANQTINTATHYTKAWSASPNGVDGVKVGANFTMKAPGGRATSAGILSTMSRNQSMRILARGMASTPYLGLAITAYQIYDALRVRENPDGEGLLFDEGTPPALQGVEQWNISGYQGGSCQAAAAAYRDAAYPSAGGANCAITMEDGRQRGFWTIKSASGACCVASGVVYAEVVQKPICPAIPGGGVPAVDFDGKCPTDTFTSDISVEEAASREALRNAAKPDTTRAMAELALALDEMFERVPVNIEELDGSPPVVGDVPNVSGGTVKVTQPDGTTVTTATAWDFKPYGLTKGWGSASSGAWDKETTTTTCPGGGTQCTTDVTREEHDPQGGTEAEGDDPERDFCKDNPTRAGCVELGEMPTDEVPKQTKTIVYDPETLNLPVGCPGELSFTIFGVSYSSGTFARACDAATSAKPFVLLAGAFSALMICVAALGGNKGAT